MTPWIIMFVAMVVAHMLRPEIRNPGHHWREWLSDLLLVMAVAIFYELRS